MYTQSYPVELKNPPCCAVLQVISPIFHPFVYFKTHDILPQIPHQLLFCVGTQS